MTVGDTGDAGAGGGFNKNLLLASLLAGGSAMTQGESPWPAVSNVAMQQMAAQNYMKTLKAVLGADNSGTIPEGSELKLDSKGANLKLGHDQLGALLSGNQGGFQGLGIGNPGTYTPGEGNKVTLPSDPAVPATGGQLTDTNKPLTDTDQKQLMSAYLNPSPSPLDNITASDLVGLTPKDISQALGIKLGIDKLNLAERAQAAEEEAAARMARIREEAARTGRINAITDRMKLFREFPLLVPGLGVVTLDEWKALDTKTKAYSYYVYDAKIRGEEVLPYNEWSQQTDEPTAKQIYDIAKDDPGFEEFYFKSKKAGATRISLGEKVETAEAMADVKAKKYFTSPKGLASDVEDYIESEDVQNELFQFAGEPNKLSMEKVRLKEKFITNKIKSAGGEIVSARLDGRDFVWTVKWPDGTTSEVRYAN